MSRLSIRDDKLASSSKTFFDLVQNRILLFVLTFVIGLFLALVSVGLYFGGQDRSPSFMTVRFIAYILGIIISSLPLAILFFPIGLGAYLPDDATWHWVIFAWVFYFVTPILGIVVKRRWFVLLMYTMFIIVLILNIAGCGPVIYEGRPGLD